MLRVVCLNVVLAIEQFLVDILSALLENPSATLGEVTVRKFQSHRFAGSESRQVQR